MCSIFKFAIVGEARFEIPVVGPLGPQVGNWRNRKSITII